MQVAVSAGLQLQPEFPVLFTDDEKLSFGPAAHLTPESSSGPLSANRGPGVQPVCLHKERGILASSMDKSVLEALHITIL